MELRTKTPRPEPSPERTKTPRPEPSPEANYSSCDEGDKRCTGETATDKPILIPATLSAQLEAMQPLFEERHQQYLRALKAAIPELQRRYNLPVDVDLPMFVYDEFYQYDQQLRKCDDCQGARLDFKGREKCDGWIHRPDLRVGRTRNGEVYDVYTTQSVYPCKAKHRQMDRRRRRVKMLDSGLPTLYEGVYPSDLFDRELAALLRESYETYVVARQHKFADHTNMPIGLTISGKVSTGKTEAAVSIVNFAFRHRFNGTVAFATVTDMYDRIKKAPNYRQFDGDGNQLDPIASEVQAFYFDADILVIDDLGMEPADAAHRAFVDRLIMRRWNCSDRWLTYVTTNLTAAQLTDRYGERCFSRIAMMAPIYETTPFRPSM